jgi:DNA-cytosine methyltransferase
MEKIKIVDLFCGIGGMRLAFERAGAVCVFSSEIDKYAVKTYAFNFGGTRTVDGKMDYYLKHLFAHDIRLVEEKYIPDHDILLAGFPCQPFSHAGPKEGFSHPTSGTLFFDVLRILKEKRPRAFLLENVRGLTWHDKGKTLETILTALRDELGYTVNYKILNAKNFVPQIRNRIYIVGMRDGVEFDWETVKIPDAAPKLKTILHKEGNGEVREKYTLSERLWEGYQRHKRESKARGAGWGYGLFTGEDQSNTLTADYRKGGQEILISQEPYIEADGDRFFDHEGGKVQGKYTLKPERFEKCEEHTKKSKEKGSNWRHNVFSGEDICSANTTRSHNNGHILIQQEPFIEHDGDRFFNFEGGNVQEKYTLPKKSWDYWNRRTNGFHTNVLEGENICGGGTTRSHNNGNICIKQAEGKRPRRLTPRECARIMGFPDSFIIPVSDNQAYKQLGNSVVVPLIEVIARAMIEVLSKEGGSNA